MPAAGGRGRAKNGNKLWVLLSLSAVSFVKFPRMSSFLASLASWR